MSFHSRIPPPRSRAWAGRKPRARGRRASVSWAEVRLAGTVGLLVGLALPHLSIEWPAAWNVREVVQSGSYGARTAPSGARFGLCQSGGGTNCVVDGDTIYWRGDKIRVADIDTPETHPPRCPEEARLGEAATLRMQALLNAGPFTLDAIERDEDRYGRKLRVVVRDGESLGDTLVAEGLARPYGGGRRSWC
jgi:endonuclease YncB( thermonuclease family)